MKNCPNQTNFIAQNEQKMATEVFEDFISAKTIDGLSPYTAKTYRNHFNFFLKIIGGDCGITDISTYTYKCFYNAMLQRNVSPATIKSYSNTLRSFFNWCYAEGYIYYNVYIPLVKAQTTIKATYSDEELTSLMKKPNLAKCSFTEYKIWVLENLVLCTGLRLTSALNIRVADINLADGSVIINKTKNTKAFVTYLNKDMVVILKEYLKYRNASTSADFLFCTDCGTKLARRTAQQEIRDYNLKRNVSKTSIHLMRHTFARNSILAGQDVFTLMHILQHANIQTTYNYLKTLGLDIKDRVDVYNPQQLYTTRKIKMR